MNKHGFIVEVAEECDVHCAILLDNIAYWIEKNQANKQHFCEGRYWTYNSKRAFAELFPYLTERQVKYALEKLRDKGLIMVRNFNKASFDKTLWYALTDEAIEKYYPHLEAKLSDGLDKNVQGRLDKIVQPIPNNKPNNKQEREKSPKKAKGFVPPTVDEVREYIVSHGYNVDADVFVAYYAANHWKDAKDLPVKNWKQRVISWVGRDNLKTQTPPPSQPIVAVEREVLEATKELSFEEEMEEWNNNA